MIFIFYFVAMPLFITTLIATILIGISAWLCLLEGIMFGVVNITNDNIFEAAFITSLTITSIGALFFVYWMFVVVPSIIIGTELEDEGIYSTKLEKGE